MSADKSNPTATSIATVPDWESIPCVQYGFPEDVGPRRAPKLQMIFDPIPEGAITASPVYLLPKKQYEQQRDREHPYRVGDGYTMKATELQDKCEADDHILYPIHIESDEYRNEGPETLVSWFREFVEDYLEVPFDTCTLYFSGNRSIHVHVPRFVKSESDREQLKELAKLFCEETGAELDLGLYSRKRMFRLPGVEHLKTNLSKVEIESHWDNSRIFEESMESNPTVPDTYERVLRKVFASQESLTVGTAQPSTDNPHELFRVLDSDKTLLEFSIEGPEIEKPLIEYKEEPDNLSSTEKKRWAMYSAKEFSPYALADGNGRSVAVVRVKGTPFARRNVTTGNSSRPIHALIPAYFYGAQGCAGEEFTKDHLHAPLQLSKKDYGKWEYEPGDNVVIIGGKSGSSRIFSVTSWEATVVGHALTGEDGSRDAALDYLSDQGYDVGASGSKRSPENTTASSGGSSSGDPRSIPPARKNSGNDAEDFQRRAEQEGIDSLLYPQINKIAHRHLLRGWVPTWEWFEEQYGSQFDPEQTWENLRSIVEEDSYDEYDHVEVPEKPL